MYALMWALYVNYISSAVEHICNVVAIFAHLVVFWHTCSKMLGHYAHSTCLFIDITQTRSMKMGVEA